MFLFCGAPDMRISNILFCLAFSALLSVPPSFADAPASQKSKSTAQHTKKATAEKGVAAESIKKGVSIDTLQGPRLAAAIGHYSRARALLISAVNEFDAGLKIANPDLLMNSDGWRRAVMDQASELDKVLSPQAASPTGGVKYPADSRLLSESVR